MNHFYGATGHAVKFSYYIIMVCRLREIISLAWLYGHKHEIFSHAWANVKPRISADISYRLPNLRAVYVHFTGSSCTELYEGRQNRYSLWMETGTL